MASNDLIDLEGVVVANNRGFFTVKCDIGEGDKKRSFEVEAKPSGKMRSNFIKILVGDKVSVQVSPYDMAHGRITFRHK